MAKCAKCGKKFGFIARIEIWKSKKVHPELYNKALCLECAQQLKQELVGKQPFSMKDSEYEACIDNLGLLEGEEIKLQFVCLRQTVGPPSVWGGSGTSELKKGLLVFTNDNMIFMQKEGKSDYSQALRTPLQEIIGITTGGSFFLKRLRISVGARGSSECHEFIPSAGQGSHGEIRRSIEKLLDEIRQEKKRLAQEALAKGTVPAMIFCRFCGTRNKSDESLCANCGAPLTEQAKSTSH